MTIQLSVATRNARLQALIDGVGSSPVLKVFTGAQPANCAAADSGTQLVAAALPATWMGTVAAGSASKAGSWVDLEADASGDAGHWRLYSSGGACHLQGSVTVESGGGDMEIADSVTLAAGVPFTVSTFTLTEAGA